MNHAPAINIWKGTNRVSRLWEELAADHVSPDPVKGELTFPKEEGRPEASFSFVPVEEETREPSLLKKVSFESIQWVRHALETLTAPAEEPPKSSEQEVGLEMQPASPAEWEREPEMAVTWQADYSCFVRVSREPEPQPGSVIDTRRMAYGLKIPARPLHKRPIYQRVFFCVRQMISRGDKGPAPVT